MPSELAQRIAARLKLLQDEPVTEIPKTCDVCLIITSGRLAKIIDEELQAAEIAGERDS